MIYFIRDSASGRIKIGYSANPSARLSQIQSASASPVELVALEEGDYAREAALHGQFSGERLRGEWFAPADCLMAYIAALPPMQEPLNSTRVFWNGWSQKELAAEIGVSAAMLSHIKLGVRKPSPDVAIRIQEATGVSAVKLVFGELAERAA